MVEFIKKNKKIIISSSIFTGINSNIYCGSGNISGKEDKNKKLTTPTTPTTPTTTTSNNNNNNETPKNETPKKKETPNVDTLKNKKNGLKNLLKTVSTNNNELEENDRFKIDITPEIIDSKNNETDLNKIENELNNIKDQIINKISEKDQEKAKEIVRNECITLFNNCEDLNKDLENDKKIDLGITKKQIEDEKDINNLNTIKINLNNKKIEIEKIIKNIKENLINNLKASNKKLKNIIQGFYEKEVVKIKYDDEINKEGITLIELRKINKEFKYIFKDILNSSGEYAFLYYEDLMNDFDDLLRNNKTKICNIYRIMNILHIFFNTIDIKGVSKYVLSKNKENDIDPFTLKPTGFSQKIFKIFLGLLQNNNFSNTLILFMRNFDGNSYIANDFKLKFFSNNSKTPYYKLNLVSSYIINDFSTLMYKNEKDNFLVNNKIILGSELDKKELLSVKFTNLEELNNFIYPKASTIVTNDKLKEKK